MNNGGGSSSKPRRARSRSHDREVDLKRGSGGGDRRTGERDEGKQRTNTGRGSNNNRGREKADLRSSANEAHHVRTALGGGGGGGGGTRSRPNEDNNRRGRSPTALRKNHPRSGGQALMNSVDRRSRRALSVDRDKNQNKDPPSGLKQSASNNNLHRSAGNMTHSSSSNSLNKSTSSNSLKGLERDVANRASLSPTKGEKSRTPSKKSSHGGQRRPNRRPGGETANRKDNSRSMSPHSKNKRDTRSMSPNSKYSKVYDDVKKEDNLKLGFFSKKDTNDNNNSTDDNQDSKYSKVYEEVKKADNLKFDFFAKKDNNDNNNSTDDNQEPDRKEASNAKPHKHSTSAASDTNRRAVGDYKRSLSSTRLEVGDTNRKVVGDYKRSLSSSRLGGGEPEPARKEASNPKAYHRSSSAVSENSSKLEDHKRDTRNPMDEKSHQSLNELSSGHNSAKFEITRLHNSASVNELRNSTGSNRVRRSGSIGTGPSAAGISHPQRQRHHSIGNGQAAAISAGDARRTGSIGHGQGSHHHPLGGSRHAVSSNQNPRARGRRARVKGQQQHRKNSLSTGNNPTYYDDNDESEDGSASSTGAHSDTDLKTTMFPKKKLSTIMSSDDRLSEGTDPEGSSLRSATSVHVASDEVQRFDPALLIHSAKHMKSTKKVVKNQKNTNTTEDGDSSDDDQHIFQEFIFREKHNIDVFKRYEIVSEIGTSDVGKVYKCKIKDNKAGGTAFKRTNLLLKQFKQVERRDMDVYYALKNIKLDAKVSSIKIKEIKNEVNILKTLDHPYIIKVFDVYYIKNQIDIVMELCEGGDLLKYFPYSEQEASSISKRILSALRYMHDRDIMHRDLKLETVLFEKDDRNSEVKLVHFASSHKYNPGERLQVSTADLGDIYAMSPQVLQGLHMSQADLWSVGVIIYTLLGSKKPFYHNKRSRMVDMIMQGSYPSMDDKNDKRWSNISQDAKHLVKNLLVVDPDKRYNAIVASQHPWLNNQNLSTERVSKDVFQDVGRSLVEYRNTSGLKKLALNVIAHRSTTAEIQELRKVFESYDKDNNGIITAEELKAALLSQNRFTDEMIYEIFESLDVNKDGHIMYTEFLAATIERRGRIEEERIAEAFDRLDTDDSGYITRSNLRKIFNVSSDYAQEINDIMKESDLNKDGKIQWDEFLHAFRSKTSALKSEMMSED